MKNVLTYKGFIGSVLYHDEEKFFYGTIVGINELVIFEGATLEELEQGFQFMVDEHINDGTPV